MNSKENIIINSAEKMRGKEFKEYVETKFFWSNAFL